MKATKRSSAAIVGCSWVGALVVATGVCAVGQWLGAGPRVGGDSPEIVASLARVERRLNDLERQFELAMQARAEPAVVERIAEERGLEMDDAWNEYFDGIVTRLERVEAKLDGGELPDELTTDEGQLAFAQRIAPLILGARNRVLADNGMRQFFFGDMSGNASRLRQTLSTGLQQPGRFQMTAEGVSLTIGGDVSVADRLILFSQLESQAETTDGETGSAPPADGDP